MNTATVTKASEPSRKFGAIKWFGGYNNRTGKENKFGFVESADGHDVFLHRREWQSKSLPSEGDIVTFWQEEVEGKISARGAMPVASAGLSAVELYDALCSPPFCSDSPSLLSARGNIKEALKGALYKNLQDVSAEEIRQLTLMSQSLLAPSLFELAAKAQNPSEIYGKLAEAAGLRITDDVLWLDLPSSVLRGHESDIAAHLAQLDPVAARQKCQIHLKSLPASLLTYLLARQVYTTTSQLGPECAKRIFDYLKAVVTGAKAFPDYLQTCVDVAGSANNGRSASPILQAMLENLQFKKSLFEKNTEFIDIYEASTRLSRNIETFVLYHLFKLICAGNDREVVFTVLMQRLWEALMAGALTLDNQQSKLASLFPSCITMGGVLSCEAVYWEKEELFLCRGRPCRDHQVLPNPARPYVEFSIYDWLSHYGIDYMTSGKPQMKDFPIKLAGYFNRLREIFPILHCRTCSELMLPNMKYARTQYKELRNGVVELKEMAAAYRLTVFHCNHQGCNEYGVEYYISHCVGFGCHHIIDSRVLTRRCSEGRYICAACGSCCAGHATSNPAGLCSECGCHLQVYNEPTREGQHLFNKKYVRCVSTSCGHRIGPGNLPAKFSRLRAENEAIPRVVR